MKKLMFIVIGLALGCNSSQKIVTKPDNMATKVVAATPKTFAESITEEELKEHLYTYASDKFEGRETGQPGQKMAVEYLKARYEELGIPAAKSDGDYFQKVPLEIAKLPEGNIIIAGKNYEQGKDFVSFDAMNETFSEIVYVGYGIEDEKYSDYTDLDVSGKIVLMKNGEPMNNDGTFVLTGTTTASKWSSENTDRAGIAKEKGAKGVLMYSPELFPRVLAYYNRLANNPSGGNMSIKDDSEKTFMAIIGDEMVKSIYPDIATKSETETIAVSTITELTGNPKEVDSENVAAMIKGSEKPDEYLIISSHLDHIGISADGQVNNGADDDGSGSVALLEIAEAFKKAADAGQGPRRSIVFLHVTGEEKGLLGSKYYTDFDPIFPLEQTVADLNIDMIGRIDPKREGERNYVYLIGSDKLSTELHNISEAVNKKYMNIVLDYTYNDENDPNRFYYRSDHYNFAKNNIPIIFYFNGTHDDYHRPGDTPDKINYDLLQNRARLVFYTAWEVANRDARVVVDKASK